MSLCFPEGPHNKFSWSYKVIIVFLKALPYNNTTTSGVTRNLEPFNAYIISLTIIF